MRLNLKFVPVVDRDGKQLFEVTREEAIAGIRAGLAFAVGAKAIRLKDKPGPASSPALSSADVEALASATAMGTIRRERLTAIRRERLTGWGVLRVA